MQRRSSRRERNAGQPGKRLNQRAPERRSERTEGLQPGIARNFARILKVIGIAKGEGRRCKAIQIEPSIAKAMRLPSGDHDGHHGVLLAAGAK